MTNIWSFLVQTLAVSLAAAMLLAVKSMLADKLSPRWQYGVWGILALRIVLPAAAGRSVLLPVGLWIETLKGAAEAGLSSAYSSVYEPISVALPFPMIVGRPASITDWLFVIYAVGVLAVLAWYIFSYLRLKLLLRGAGAVLVETQLQIAKLCETYSLPVCRAVAVPGLPSAFVCGVLRPVLVLPANEVTDEKVLLHELMHLKYRDALQSILWCVLRSLHWCNPFMQLIFDRIGNDLEALCDQRVLERLEGEERREYGGILLSMANDRYPRAFGTTSVSNGGKNIARRIAAIVRFKKYPKGMGLVSLCIAFVLAVPLLAGTTTAYASSLYQPNGDGMELTRAMALARTQRCTTVAGALDTYAKGLMFENGIYIAMASPLSEQPAIEARLRQNQDESWVAYHLDSGDELEYLLPNEGYSVKNLELQADGSYTALLSFNVSSFVGSDGEVMVNENGYAYQGSVKLPVTVSQDNGWVVAESGERSRYNELNDWSVTGSSPLFWIIYEEQEGESGSVAIGVRTAYTVPNSVSASGWNPFNTSYFSEAVKPSAEFDSCRESVYIEYCFKGSEEQRQALSNAAFEIAPLSALDDEPEFSGMQQSGNSSWASSDGTSGTSCDITAGWDGTLFSGGGSDVDTKDGLAKLPAGYAVRIYHNGEAVEDFFFSFKEAG